MGWLLHVNINSHVFAVLKKLSLAGPDPWEFGALCLPRLGSQAQGLEAQAFPGPIKQHTFLPLGMSFTLI